MRRISLGVLAALALFPAAASAAPVATDDASYAALGAVFPDPLAGCQAVGSPCDPAARGTVAATSFIGVNEFRDALVYMNSKPEWQRYMEVITLDGKDGDGSATRDEVTADPAVMFPGNTLPPEFSPRATYVSAGLPTTGIGRQKSDLNIVRVTDETVPDAGKKRYTLSLSIHGIERAGIEGGTRAMEDLVTSFTTGRDDEPVLPEAVRAGAPTFNDVLQKTIIYFTYPNPDGWRRGTYDTGGLGSSFQRYNGNGVDPNRDYTDIGYNYRGYSGGSEPETRAFKGFYEDVLGSGATFQAGDDLHGQPFADALSYTLLPHGQHDLAKDTRIRETAKLINRAQFEAVKWEPRIMENVEVSEPQGNCGESPLGSVCPQIYAQTWGSVYDTINYTTTGTIGDYFDSTVGLNADGIDNEMSFSHLDKQIVFNRSDEQLHVAGNKAIIYAHAADIIAPVTGELDPAGAMGYVPNKRLTREETANDVGAPPNTVEQEPIVDELALPDPDADGASTFEFEVKRTQPTDTAPGIFNGGMNVMATGGNLGGASSGSVKLIIQCRGCDDHVGAQDAEQTDWITVAEDYNQSPVYAQSGAVASVNLPDPFFTGTDGKAQPVEWRALVSTSPLGVVGAPIGPVRIDVEFFREAATDDGNNCQQDVCDQPPTLAAYDVANTDFFTDLNKYIPGSAEDFGAVDPRKVIDGTESLDGLHTLVLADELLPGYRPAGGGGGESGPPTEDLEFAGSADNVPGQEVESCRRDDTTTDRFDFTIPDSDDNAAMDIHIEWLLETTDYDLYVQRKQTDGSYADIGESAGFVTFEEDVEVQNPEAGDYRVEVVLCSGNPTDVFEGTVTFTGRGEAVEPGPSDYTEAEKDAWVAKLKEYAEGGGNLVLTDKALVGLPDLVPAIEANTINRQTVYVGQMAVTRCDGYAEDGTCDAEVRTLDDPLMANVNQLGSRFNTGFRRQLFEPTPIGYAIQNQGGADFSTARQYDIDSAAFEDAGGRVAATSADDGERDAAPVTNRVTVGEIPVGDGQIRVAGALLPQPSNEFDHPLGVTPYAVTYTGYILTCNLLGAACSVKPVGAGGGPGVEPTPTPTATSSPGPGGPDGPGTSPTPTATTGPGVTPTPDPGPRRCVTARGLKSVEVTPAGAGARFSFERRSGVTAPVQVNVYKPATATKVIKTRKVKRYSGLTGPVTWDGRDEKGRRMGNGYYFARFLVKTRNGFDVQRVVLRRSNGKFSVRKPFDRRATCSTLRAYKLSRPVFGGTTNFPLRATFRLGRTADVEVALLRKGKVVSRVRRPGQAAGTRVTVRLKGGLRRGDYAVRLTAGGQTTTLFSRRI